MDLDYLIASALQKEYEEFRKEYSTREKMITDYILEIMEDNNYMPKGNEK